MLRSFHALGCLAALSLLVGCSTGPASTFGDTDSGAPDSGDPFANQDAGGGGFKDSGAAPDASTSGPAVIYAHTDTELYTMDVTSKALTDIGAFDDGTTTLGNVTDLAVNSAGEVWVNTETAIFKAVVPQSPGKVHLTKVVDIKVSTSQKFYALGFAPAGVLGSGETLVAGDSLGDLYAVDANGTTTKLGSFGTAQGGGTYELSGDIVFYTQNGKPRGLATVRLYQSGQPNPNSDILAEIDVAALSAAYASKTPASTLKKQFIGSGAGFGRLYGVGAWNDSVYAFSRQYTDSKNNLVPAQLVRIDSSGKGTSIQSFPNVTSGWSGAGVTTSATVTVLPPN